MHHSEGQLVFATTDLSAHAECERTTHLERAVLAGALTRPGVNDIERRMLEKRGHEHEARVLDHYRALGLEVVTVAPGPTTGSRAQDAARRTEEAMRAGADVIYQGVLVDGRWLGRPDFLIKTPAETRFGAHGYEAADAKLSREPTARALLQLCAYTEQLGRVQGRDPERFWIVRGGSTIEPTAYALADYAAIFRRARACFEASIDESSEAGPYPEPVDYCDVCRWWKRCEGERRRDDHLSLVAGITRRQRDRLEHAGVKSLEALATLPREARFSGLNPDPLWRAREQARLQLEARMAGSPRYELLLDGEPGSGLESLPEPSPGDVFLDLEGDAFVRDGGLDYLFGWIELAVDDDPFSFEVKPAEPRYRAVWAHDRDQEKRAFEALMDAITARRREHPSMHIYHFGQRETDALKKLSCRHATREADVDQLLRGRAFVDLHRVVRHGVRASVESYSLKELEPFHGFQRAVALRDAASAMQWFGWLLETGDPSLDRELLERTIEGYNRDDCFSTLKLRDWLEERRRELGRHRVIKRPAPVEDKASEKREEQSAEVARVAGALLADLPAPPLSASDRARAVLAHLLDWHWREAKSSWWEYFRARDVPREERLEDRSVLDGIRYVGEVGTRKRSTLHKYEFPPQEHGIRPGNADDPDSAQTDARGNPKGVKSVDVVEVGIGHLIVSRKTGTPPDSFRSLIPSKPIPTDAQQRRLLELGSAVAAHGIEGAGPFAAARDLLQRSAPRAGQAPGAPLVSAGEDTTSAICRLALNLDRSVLAIQGPPGSGKTYRAAQMILALLAAGKKVGVTANSHKVILGVLKKVLSSERGDLAKVLHIGDEDEAQGDDLKLEFSKSHDSVSKRLSSGELNLVGGTTWAWSRDDFAGALDVLVVDEAGQLSLANVLAASHAARSLVLLGDPAQLEQPQKGVHPEGADASALEHLLGDDLTIPPDRGVFLPVTHRLHPEVCQFTSEVFYGGRLTSLESTRHQRVDGPGIFQGTGLRFVPSEHRGNTNSSDEEVEVIRGLVAQLLQSGATFTDSQRRSRAMTESDVLVVAPYNAQVTALKRALPAGVSVGTVDKFQGREAPIVIYSLTSSSAEDAPRGLDFLYNLNRLNVATSRAQALVVLVGSPRLAQARCKTPRQMKLVNALCRYLEVAH